jgi:hypothetical protein
MITSESVEPRLGFLSYKILRHIEAHSDKLADGLWARIGKCERLHEYRQRVPQDELRQRTYEIYNHLGDWLEFKSEQDIERRYIAIGERRASQGVLLSQLLLSIVATKEHIWEHITDEIMTEHPGEMIQVLELSRSIETFFDRAVYYAAIGFERHHASHHKTAASGRN